MRNAPTPYNATDSAMTCFGFRPPQFSEELTWLPDWLQQNLSQQPDQKESERPPEVMPLAKGIVNEGNLQNLSDTDEERYTNFQLFLSGEDSSPISFTPYPAKQDKSQTTDAAEAVLQSSKDVPMEKISTPAQPRSKTFASDSSCKLGRHLKDDDLDASVELSIAASEAVVIHELVKSDSALRPLSVESVIEVAMRVKEARIQKLDDMSDAIIEETCKDDSLMDLDDFTMLDAFQDVGLPIVFQDERGICNPDVSQVKETPLTEIYAFDGKYKWPEHGATGICGISGWNDSLADLALKKRSKEDIPKESVNCRIVHDASRDLHMGYPTSVDNHISKMPHQPPVEDSIVFSMEKEIDAAVWAKQNTTKCIPKLFVCETSFLSESDVAVDQNSVAQKLVTYVQANSDVSMSLHDFHKDVNDNISFSQEVVGSSSTSLADPLCSFVPCSISNEICDLLGEPVKVARKLLNLSEPTARFESANLYKTTSGGIMLEKDSTEPKEDCQTGLRRSLSSLKTYSVLPSSHQNKLESTRFHSNLHAYSGLIPPTGVSEHNNRFTGKSHEVGITFAGNVEGDHDKTIEHSTGKMTLIRSLSNECKKNAAGLLHYENPERKLPLITDSSRIHLLPSPASEYLVRVYSQKNKDKLVMTPFNALKVRQSKNFLNIKLQHNYLKFRKVPGRKCVRFSGLDMELSLGKLTHPTKRLKHFDSQLVLPTQGLQNLVSVMSIEGASLVFDGIGFLITGFPRRHGKDIESLIQKHGGSVLIDIPSTDMRGKSGSNILFKGCLIVISPKKLKTTKFLYGCAVRALLLKVSWIIDSIAAGSTLPPENYMIVSNRADAMVTCNTKSFHHSNAGCIFVQVGFVLHGKRSFFMKFAKVIKHGGGEAYGNLHQLVRSLDNGKVFTGFIVTEYDKRPSRHLHQCAMERKIVMMPVSWLLACLYSGELLSLFGENQL